ncbi:hypothetical protein BH09PLA1_BH09PLA1_03020 [soil metagenome]
MRRDPHRASKLAATRMHREFDIRRVHRDHSAAPLRPLAGSARNGSIRHIQDQRRVCCMPGARLAHRTLSLGGERVLRSYRKEVAARGKCAKRTHLPTGVRRERSQKPNLAVDCSQRFGRALRASRVEVVLKRVSICTKRTQRNSSVYGSISETPVISAGRSMPIIRSAVGATSASRPPARSFLPLKRSSTTNSSTG